MNSEIHRLTVLTSSALVLLGLMLAPLVGAAERSCPKGKFPASGQTTARQADINDGTVGNLVDVPDDGTVQAGATLRYRDNGDGSITDLNTNLTWEKKSDNGDPLHDKDNTYTWSGGGETIWDWVKDINTEGGTGFAGHNDWRIPNVKELQSIIDYERGGPAIDPVFNTNCQGSTVLTGSCTALFHWSSSTPPFFPTFAWNVGFNIGDIGAFDKFIGLHVRAVRGGCQ